MKKRILLIIVGLSIFLNANFIRNGNGVVTDSRTDLQWQDDYSDNNDSIKNTVWIDAIGYCEDLNLDGKTDWRLPNKNELLSIVEHTRDHPSIDVQFINNFSGYYWSSTSYKSNYTDAWVVNFGYGGTYGNGKGDSSSVRCVRTGE